MVKLLTAGTSTGPEDFGAAEEGEPVRLTTVCDRDADAPADAPGCGCSRAFTGLRTRKATSRAVVRDVEIDPPGLHVLAFGHWSDLWAGAASPWRSWTSWPRRRSGRVLAEAAPWPVGTRLARCHDDLRPVDE